MSSLYLHTDDPRWIPDDHDGLLQLLDELGLGTSGRVGVEDCFSPGSQFLSLVTFLGCSPRAVLDPGQAGDGQPACFVRLHYYPEVRFLADTRSMRVRCPQCRTPLTAIDTNAHDALFTCADCAGTVPVSQLDWRQSAGFSRCFIEIGGIHPHEAVPSDRLLSRLREYSGTGWRYFYAG